MDDRFRKLETEAVIRTQLGNYFVLFGMIPAGMFQLPNPVTVVRDVAIDWEKDGDWNRPIRPKPTLVSFEMPHIIEWRRKEIWVYDG